MEPREGNPLRQSQHRNQLTILVLCHAMSQNNLVTPLLPHGTFKFRITVQHGRK